MKPDVYQFLDYRIYLKNAGESLAKEKSWSLRSWSKHLGISVSLLSLVISGKRNLTLDMQNIFCEKMKLSESQKKYFLLLVVYNDSKDPDEKVQALQSMKRLKGFREASQNEFEAFEYLTNWLYVVIRESVFLHDIEWNAEWIQAKLWPKIGIQEIQRAMDYLIRKKYVQVESQKPTVKDFQINCDSEIYRISLAQFHRQMFERGIESIESVDRDKRLILGHTLATSAEAKKKIEEVILGTLAQIQKIEAEDSGLKDEVYHIGLASFPLTHSDKLEQK